MYTLFLRDGQGREFGLTELAISHITESTVFICPEEHNQLTDIHLEVIRNEFKRAGVHAIVCNVPMRLYQMRPYADGYMPTLIDQDRALAEEQKGEFTETEPW